MTDLYTHTGKQILRNGRHFGDACDEEAAAQIVRAMNHEHPMFFCSLCHRREDAHNDDGEVQF